MKYLLVFLVCVFQLSCKVKNDKFEIITHEKTDSDYPDNPKFETRHSQAQQILFKKIVLKNTGKDIYDLNLFSHEDGLLEISLKDLPLLEMMPTAPDFIKKDKYLTYIGLINQEWNRQQVQFKLGQFSVKGNSKINITRVDLARNCLNAYLWEVLVYAIDSDGTEKSYWQCWFDFPKDEYKRLFELRNKLPYEDFRAGLENWIDPPSEKIDFNLLRKVNSEKDLEFLNKNQGIYAFKGELSQKRKNIIFPKAFNRINDFLSDSTLFATFSIPGYYNTKDPRKTQLSKLGILQKVRKKDITNSLGQNSIELELTFLSNSDNKTITKLIFGGFDLNQIPELDDAQLNDGWKTSMGIANHTFYETIEYQQKHLTKDNAFYGFLTDESNNWLDSHKIGIDGPIFYFEKNNRKMLHLNILSFERHAIVGHYIIKL